MEIVSVSTASHTRSDQVGGLVCPVLVVWRTILVPWRMDEVWVVIGEGVGVRQRCSCRDDMHSLDGMHARNARIRHDRESAPREWEAVDVAFPYGA